MEEPVVEPSRAQDVHDILKAGLRPADALEVECAGGNPACSLITGLAYSHECLSIVVDGRAVAMMGASPMPGCPKLGVVWLLGTRDLDKIKVPFIRGSRQVLDRIAEPFDVLANCVHQDNHLHIRWLSWLGFKFLAKRGPFIEFARYKHV